MKYYVDIYTAGSPRDLRGPFSNFEEASAVARGEGSTVAREVPVEVSAYDSTVEDLEREGEEATLVEAWAESEYSEDYSAVYSVE